MHYQFIHGPRVSTSFLLSVTVFARIIFLLSVNKITLVKCGKLVYVFDSMLVGITHFIVLNIQ